MGFSMRCAEQTQQQLKVNGDKFVDGLLRKCQIKNDAALCRILEIAPPRISKIRHGKIPISADLILRIHDTLALSIKEIRKLMAFDHPIKKLKQKD